MLADGCAFSYGDLIFDCRTVAYEYFVAYLAAAANADTVNDKAMLTNLGTVADVHMMAYFSAFANFSGANYRPVY
jgi:hypothetical protein